MGQTPQLDSERQDAQLKAIKGNSPSASKQDKDDSIYASAKYEIAKKQYDKAHPAPTPPSKPAPAPTSTKVPSYKKGGMVRKTGLARLHKGERVVPKAKVGKVNKMMQKRG